MRKTPGAAKAMLSRRKLLSTLPALTAWGLGATGAAWADQPPLAVTPAPIDDAASNLTAWLDAYGRPTAAVRINGQGPFAFQVDTGSSTTVLSDKLVAALGLAPAGQVTLLGTTGTAIAQLVHVNQLQTGAVTRDDIRLAVLPVASLWKADGILGADVFAGRRLSFNIREKSVRVEPSSRGVRLPQNANMRIRNGLLAEVQGRVGTVSTKLMLDTGAQNCIANLALSAALRRAHPHLERVPNVGIFGVTGHEAIGELVTLPRIDLKAFWVKDASAVAADASIFAHWGLTEEPAMIVGVDLLSRLDSFSIDYGSRYFDATIVAELVAQNRVATA